MVSIADTTIDENLKNQCCQSRNKEILQNNLTFLHWANRMSVLQEIGDLRGEEHKKFLKLFLVIRFGGS